MNHRIKTSLPENRHRRVKILEACDYARMGQTRLRHLINAGEIIAYKQGRTTLVDLDSIDRYHRRLPRKPAKAARDLAL